jgi:high-affinity Fe2+/Pb2+ permease
MIDFVLRIVFLVFIVYLLIKIGAIFISNPDRSIGNIMMAVIFFALIVGFILKFLGIEI